MTPSSWGLPSTFFPGRTAGGEINGRCHGQVLPTVATQVEPHSREPFQLLEARSNIRTPLRWSTTATRPLAAYAGVADTTAVLAGARATNPDSRAAVPDGRSFARWMPFVNLPLREPEMPEYSRGVSDFWASPWAGPAPIRSSPRTWPQPRPLSHVRPVRNLPDVGLVRQERTGMMGGGFPEVYRLGADV